MDIKYNSFSGKSEYMVSIRVLVYNQAKYIANCLDSLLMQKTVFKYQIVIGDDGSDDGSTDICKSYSDRNNNIFLSVRDRNSVERLEYNKNSNAVWAYNRDKTLSECNGKYIAICDGDDYWTDPLKLQKQVDFLENNPDYAICYHKIFILNEIGDHKQIDYTENQHEVYTIDDILTRKAQVTTQSVCFRNVFTEGIPDWMTYFKSGDYPLFAYLAHFGKVKFLDDNMAVYRKSSTGVTNVDNRYFVDWYMNYIHGYDKINSHLNYEYDESFAKAQARYYYLIFWKLRINKGRFFSISFLFLEFLKHKCSLSHKFLISKFLISLFLNF